VANLRQSADEIAQVVDDQNPWRATGVVAEVLAPPVERPLARVLWRSLDSQLRRFALIVGARRVGKTTVMYQTVRHLLATGLDPGRVVWLRLDHPVLLREELGPLVRLVVEAAGASADRPLYLMLDEIVYARDWDGWLKTFYDDHWPVRILATSSATAALRTRRLESGAGRWTEHYLAPYGFGEYLDLIGHAVELPLADSLAESIHALPRRVENSGSLPALRRRFMLIGGFPELLSSEGGPGRTVDEASRLLQSQQILRTDAVESAVYKDIPQSFGVSSPLQLERLLYVLAAQVTGVLSPGKIAAELELSQPTLDRYISYLRQAFLVFTLPAFSSSEESRQRRGRKLYFVDGAVRNAALQRGLSPLSDPAELGVLTENLVAGALHSLAEQTVARLFHWRDNRREVDLVLENPVRPLAFEVASSLRHKVDGLRALLTRYPKFTGGAYLLSPDAPVRHPDADHDIGTLPLDLFLVLAGRQAERAALARVPGQAAASPPT